MLSLPRRLRTASALLMTAALTSVGLVLLGTPASAQVSLAIAPATAGDRATQAGERISVEGSAPAGRILSARLVGREEDGDQPFDAVDEALLNRTFENPLDERFQDYLRNDGGKVRGQLTLPCLFAPPSPNCSVRHDDVRTVHLEITVAPQGGPAQTGRSGEVRIDYVRPGLLPPEVVGANEVRVRFTEPVRHSQGDSPQDWRVRTASGTQVSVLAVRPETPDDCVYGPGADATAGPTGCTRTLVVGTTFDEDVEVTGQPEVEYVLALAPPASSARVAYDDYASNRVFAGAARIQDALDRIRPPAPRVDAVNGRPGADVVSDDPRIEVAVSGLRDQHRPALRVTPPGGEPYDAVVGPPATASSAVLPAVVLAGDGSYVLQAVAVDPAGNRSDALRLKASRPEGSPHRVTYVLDRVPLVAERAVADSTANAVDVFFSKPVSGGDVAAQWSVRLPGGGSATVLSASGREGTRRLTTDRRVPAGSQVVHAPPTPATDYRDANGTAVGRFVLDVDGLSVPRVDVPAGPVVTAARTQRVSGRADPGAVVRLVLDSGRDGSAAGDAEVGRADVAADGTWSVEVALAADTAHELLAEAVRGDLRSPWADVATITQDEQPPVVRLTNPTGGELYAGGSRQTVSWTFADTNAGPGEVLVSYRVGSGPSTVIGRAGSPGGSGSLEWQVPAISSAEVVVQVDGTDLAQRTGRDSSGAFTVDALGPGFTARTVDVRTVDVLFDEDVTGPDRAADWTIDGERATTVSREGRRVRLALPPTSAGFGRAGRPEVGYAPLPSASGHYSDVAGNRPRQPAVARAADGILPAAPTVTAPRGPVLTREASVPVSGTAEPGLRVLVLRGDGSQVSTAVDDAGAWSLSLPLPADQEVTPSAVVEQADGGRGPAARVPAIDQDATAPAVRITAPAPGSRIEPGTRATASWTSTDRHPVDGQTLVELSTDGGRTWRLVAQEQPRSGSAAFDVPEVRTGTAALRVTVPDQVGRRGTAVSSPIGIGMAAATPTPTPTPSTTPGALPDGTFTPAVGRLLDTRPSAGGPGQLGPGGTLRLQVAGEAGVPRTGAEAVALTLTAVQPGAKTHVSVVPTGADTEATASLTAAKGETVANHVTVRLGADGAVLLRNNSGRTHLVVDLLGWYAGDSAPTGVPYAPLPPQRLLDTREGLGAAPGQTAGTVSLRVTGRGGVPAEGVTAVVLGVAAVGPSASTHVTVWPGGRGRPETSNLNVPRGQTRANLVTVPVGPDGTVQLASGGARVHLVADVFGWYGPSAAGVLEPVEPARVLDTRTGSRRPATAGRDLVLQVAGRGGLPADGVRAVVLQLTAVAPSDSTHVTAWGGGAVPETANLNATRGTTVSTQVVVPVAADGTVRLAVGKGRVHLVADVAGWFRAR